MHATRGWHALTFRKTGLLSPREESPGPRCKSDVGPQDDSVPGRDWRYEPCFPSAPFTQISSDSRLYRPSMVHSAMTELHATDLTTLTTVSHCFLGQKQFRHLIQTCATKEEGLATFIQVDRFLSRSTGPSHPIFEMAEILYSSASGYRSRQREVEAINRTLLVQRRSPASFTHRISINALAEYNGLTYEQLVASPTFARHCNAFVRDLTRFTCAGG